MNSDELLRENAALRERLSREERQAQEYLETLERQRAEFLGTVSQELRAPLTSIEGSAAALLRTPSTLDAAEVQQFLRIIDSQADQILDLIGGLLDAARIDAGVLSVSPEPSDPAALVERAVADFQSGGGRSNVSVEYPCQGG